LISRHFENETKTNKMVASDSYKNMQIDQQYKTRLNKNKARFLLYVIIFFIKKRL
jgi:hypothetical protein